MRRAGGLAATAALSTVAGCGLLPSSLVIKPDLPRAGHIEGGRADLVDLGYDVSFAPGVIYGGKKTPPQAPVVRGGFVRFDRPAHAYDSFVLVRLKLESDSPRELRRAYWTASSAAPCSGGREARAVQFGEFGAWSRPLMVEGRRDIGLAFDEDILDAEPAQDLAVDLEMVSRDGASACLRVPTVGSTPEKRMRRGLTWSMGLAATVSAPFVAPANDVRRAALTVDVILARWVSRYRFLAGYGGTFFSLREGEQNPTGEAQLEHSHLRLGLGVVPFHSGYGALGAEVGYQLWLARLPDQTGGGKHTDFRAGPRLALQAALTYRAVPGVHPDRNLYTAGLELVVMRTHVAYEGDVPPGWVLGLGLIVY